MQQGLLQIKNTVAAEKDALISLSRKIHSRPELGDEEFFAVQTISDYLAAKGFKIKKELAGLETAFQASWHSGDHKKGCHIAFCAEYDALPEIGHACGHHLIAGASVAAAVALAGALADFSGTVSLIGTPNEEGRGGKIDLVRAGVFDDVDAAMLFHPDYQTQVSYVSQACRTFSFTFHGQNAHASGNPWDGRNALDGVIQTFNAVNALREHLRDDVRIHGIITGGGQAINIIPDRASAEFCLRSLDNRDLEEVIERVLDCARGAALASGTRLVVAETEYPYDALLTNSILAELFWESLQEVSARSWTEQDDLGHGSTDMGNVSQVVPAIHPIMAITDQKIAVHTAEFTQVSSSEEAYEIMLEAGSAMALTGFKIFSDPGLLPKIKEEFKRRAK